MGLPNFGTLAKLASATVNGRATKHYRVTDQGMISKMYVDESNGQLVRFDSSQPTSDYRYQTIYHQLSLQPMLPTSR